MAFFDPSRAYNFKNLNGGKLINSTLLLFLASFAKTLIVIGVLAIFVAGIFEQFYFIGAIGYFLLFLSPLYLFIFYFLKDFFKPVSYINSENLAESLSPTVASAFINSLKIARENKFALIEPIVFLAAFEKEKDAKSMLLRSGFGLDKDISAFIRTALVQVPRLDDHASIVSISDEMIDVFEAAKANALESGRNEVTEGDVLIALIEKSDVFKKIMFEIHIDESDLKKVVSWHELLKSYRQRYNLPLWERSWGGGVGREWSFGYTPTLNLFAKNITQEVEYLGEVHVYGRSHELDEIERILAKSGKNNVLMIGEHGIGKRTIVKGFISRIVQGKVLPALKYQQVFEVDTGALLSGSVEAGEVGQRVKKVFNEAARAGNIILFFNNFHALVSREKGAGQVNVAEMIMPYLDGAVKVIGATTNKDFHKSVEANPGIAAAFENLPVKETNEEETIQVLQEMVPVIEHRDGVFWPYQSVREAVRVSGRYIQDRPFPEKAIRVIDDVSVSVAKSGRQIVLVDDVDSLMSTRLEVPVAQAEGEEASKLLNLEEFLHKRVIGQEEAIFAVANAMRRARSGLGPKDRPIGTFLFLGPTGVGKTETSKALAEAYFGSEKSMIRFDMSEFQEKQSVYRLIGSPPAAGSEGEKGQLTTAVIDNPFSLILFDELEKAHPDILTLFLQVFDDGRLTDGTGRTIDFTNTIIICTSNAGSELIRQSILKGIRGEALKKSLLDELQQKGIFRPEFLNRFDAVVAFHPLTQDQIVKVAQMMLASLSKRMLEKEIVLKFTPQAVVKLSRIGFDPVFGARPMRRAIQEKIENALARDMLEGKIARGSSVTIEEGDIS